MNARFRNQSLLEMSSGHDESGEPLDEGPEKSDSPSPKKSVGGGEHAKPRRRGRRGKKRKQRKESGDSQPEQEGSSPFEPERDSNEEAAYSGQMLRPNAPHAPKNSTQFIIDDHNECRLYMSFETPNPYLQNRDPATANEDHVEEPIGEDAAYIDVDYQYESPQDFDNTAYYDREFELSYKSNRFEELLRLPRERLVSGLRQLEQRLKELSDDLVKENPSPILEKLQHDLLELQEKHCELKEANTRLTALVAQTGQGDEKSLPEKSLADSSTEEEERRLSSEGLNEDSICEKPSSAKVGSEEQLGKDGSCDEALEKLRVDEIELCGSASAVNSNQSDVLSTATERYGSEPCSVESEKQSV